MFYVLVLGSDGMHFCLLLPLPMRLFLSSLSLTLLRFCNVMHNPYDFFLSFFISYFPCDPITLCDNILLSIP